MESIGRGRGRRRGGRRGGGGGQPGWFLHDDRDAPELDAAGGYGQDQDVFESANPAFYSSAGNDITVRISRKGGREVSDTTGAAPAGRSGKKDGSQLLVEVNNGGGSKQRVVVVAGREGWEYQDPGGQVQGPFRATQVIKWLNMQYFDGSLLVRKVSQHGTGHWGRLDAVLKDIQREAAMAGAAASSGAAPARAVSAKGRGAGAAQVLAVPVKSQRASASRTAAAGSGSGTGRDVSGYVVSGQRPQRRQQGPADSDLSYFNGIELDGAKAPRGRRGGDREDYGGRFGGGGREDGGRGRGGRGGGRGGGRRDGRGGRGGRGGQERGGGYGGAAAEAAAAERAAVQKLFTGEVALGTEQPMWRYIDPDGNMQGPFPAKDMLGWHEAGYLHDKELPMCGTSRKVSPPNLPTPEFFVPLGALIAYVRSGKKFVAVEPDDIRTGKVPEFLQRLRGGAKPAADEAGKADGKPAADGKEGAAGKAADGKGGKKPSGPAGKMGEPAAALAANLAAAAVRNVLAALGEAPGEPEPLSEGAAQPTGQAEDAAALVASLTAAAFAAALGPATPAVASTPAAQAAAEPAARAGEQEQPAAEEEAPEHDEGEVIDEAEEQAAAPPNAEAAEQPKPATAVGPPPLLEEALELAAAPAEAPAAAGAAPAGAAAPPPLEDGSTAPADLPASAASEAASPPPLLEPAAGAVPPPLEPAGGEGGAAGSEEEEFQDAEESMASPLPSPAS